MTLDSAMYAQKFALYRELVGELKGLEQSGAQ